MIPPCSGCRIEAGNRQALWCKLGSKCCAEIGSAHLLQGCFSEQRVAASGMLVTDRGRTIVAFVRPLPDEDPHTDTAASCTACEK